MDASELGVGGLDLGRTCMILAFLLLVYLTANIIYSLTLHPLANYPGPILTATSRWPFWLACVTGRQVTWMHNLHVQYGPVVRYSPSDLSFIDQGGAEWKAIHGHEKGGRELPKAREWFVEPANGIYGINSAPTYDNHRRFRKLFAPAFSDRALKSNEPVLQKHVDLLISKLGEALQEGRIIDMVQMFQFTTFDFMADLTFGQPLGLLKGLKYSPWVDAVFDSIKVIPVAQIIQYYPWLNSLFKLLEPQSIKNMKYNHFKHSADRVDMRLERGAEKPDIWSMVLAAKEDQQLSLEEMYCHADVFMLAGSETTGTTLSGLTYHLLANPEKLALLTKQIRSHFSEDADINLQNTAGLDYLNACIYEALRLYPPVPVGVPRVVTAAEGQNIGGRWVAPGTRVSVHHYATYRSPLNFKDPDTFAPERWLAGHDSDDNSPYKDDRHECYQPFAFGPRDCLGRNLAMHEMQYIMSRLLFNFDLKPGHDVEGWTNQRAFILWEKKPLWCTLQAVAA
ncbi:isotrichodermin C-15 hydroxylase (cytochrome P-450 monooxygenase CYP65A1) [Apiospora arundinis]